ncbi:MAG: carbohydrate kinase family protein [Planctomycetota bacterium]
MNQTLDCVVAGSCVVDVVCRPVPLREAVGEEVLHPTDPIVLCPGGITANSGITMARLGRKAGVFTAVGDDVWGGLLRSAFLDEGIDTQNLVTLPGESTSTSVVLVDETGQRSFLHHGGAHKRIDKSWYIERLPLWRDTRWLLLGYYPLMPRLQEDLPEVFAAVRAAGCKTAMDASGDGGAMSPLDRILPELDLYVPSLVEARGQTGLDDPRKMIDRFRSCGASGIVGVKLGGMDGVLLSEAPGRVIHIPSARPPGPVVDSTGAGDCFLGGLITGLAGGLPLEQAGRLGAACGAISVTAAGGATAIGGYDAVARLAGLD